MTRARDLGDFIADGGAPELVVDTTTLVVDSTNNRVGVGTASPATALDVVGNATITVADNSDALTIVSTDADASVGPVLNLYRNSASPADNDILGRIVFKGEDDAGNTATFARIEAIATDVSNGSEDARIDFIAAKDDSFSTALSIVGNQIGIGTSSPNAPTAIVANSSTYEGLELITPTGDGSGEFHIGVHQNGSTGGRSIVFKRGGSDGMDTESVRIDSSGKMGINESSPIEKLHVSGQLVSTSSNSTASTSGAERAIMDLTSNAARIGHFRGSNASGSGKVEFFVDSVKRVTIDPDGKVGIGTGSPSMILDVDGSSSGSDIARFSGPNSGGLTFRNATSNEFIMHTATSDALIFGTAGNNERFRIGTSGQLGIGGANYGTSGQVLTSGGSGAAPTWADAGGGAYEVVSSSNYSSSSITINVTTDTLYIVEFNKFYVGTNGAAINLGYSDASSGNTFSNRVWKGTSERDYNSSSFDIYAQAEATSQVSFTYANAPGTSSSGSRGGIFGRLYFYQQSGKKALTYAQYLLPNSSTEVKEGYYRAIVSSPNSNNSPTNIQRIRFSNNGNVTMTAHMRVLKEA